MADEEKVATSSFSAHSYNEFSEPQARSSVIYDNKDYGNSSEYADVPGSACEDSGMEKLLLEEEGGEGGAGDPLADDESGMSWQSAGTMVSSCVCCA